MDFTTDYFNLSLRAGDVHPWLSVETVETNVAIIEQAPDLRAWRELRFALLLDAPHRVVFQDSARYPFHYGFATARLPQSQHFNRAQFDAATLRTNGQVAVLGAVVFAPSTNLLEAGIQLGGFAWPPNMAALQTALAEVRDLFTDDTDFTPAQRTAILGALQAAGFDHFAL